MWARIDSVPDAELWETHRALKASLVQFVRREVTDQRHRNGYPEDAGEGGRRRRSIPTR